MAPTQTPLGPTLNNAHRQHTPDPTGRSRDQGDEVTSSPTVLPLVGRGLAGPGGDWLVRDGDAHWRIVSDQPLTLDQHRDAAVRSTTQPPRVRMTGAESGRVTRAWCPSGFWQEQPVGKVEWLYTERLMVLTSDCGPGRGELSNRRPRFAFASRFLLRMAYAHSRDLPGLLTCWRAGSARAEVPRQVFLGAVVRSVIVVVASLLGGGLSDV